jgi:sec-independent protein translocase protein TatA
MIFYSMNMLALWVPGWPELVLIGLLVILFFGAKRIPELTKAIVMSARELKAGVKEDRSRSQGDSALSASVGSASDPAPSPPSHP